MIVAMSWCMTPMRLLVSVAILTLAACTDGDPEVTPDGDADADADADGDADAGQGIPCAVNDVLEICRDCHTSPPRYGAPMPLRTWDDVHAPAESDPSREVWELMRERINDPEDPMPPVGTLTDEEKSTLDAWLADGAPLGDDAGCEEPDPDPEDPFPYGPDALPCTPSATFTAHGATEGSKFHVPDDAGNLYQCFTFASPFDGVEQGTAWAPIVDDVRVLHHWILYRTAEPQEDGGSGPCNMPRDATFVAGWAPGGLNYEMPPDVGLELPGPADSLILQVHYHNVAGFTDADDASGVALCTTPTPRTHDAGIYTLGSIAINIPAGAEGVEVSHTCPSWLTRFLPEPVHMIASFPHMHGLGRTFLTEILRNGNESALETLVDVPRWDFEGQRFYGHDPSVTFNPGDAIRTTCVYDNPTDTAVRFGERTEDEMCFNFVLLYPISLFTGQRTCAGL